MGVDTTMKRVKIIKNWTDPDPLRQTPGGKGVWRVLISH